MDTTQTKNETSRKFYAKLWHAGYRTRHASGGNCVRVFEFGSRAERDEACRAYRAPNHCPSARLQAVQAGDEDVRLHRRAGTVETWRIYLALGRAEQQSPDSAG